MSNKNIFFIISVTSGRAKDDPKVRAVLQLKRMEISDSDLDFLIRIGTLSNGFKREGLENSAYYIPSGTHNEFMVISRDPAKVFNGIHHVPKVDRSGTYETVKRMVDEIEKLGFREMTAEIYFQSASILYSEHQPVSIIDDDGLVHNGGFFESYNVEQRTINVDMHGTVQEFELKHVRPASRNECEEFLGGDCGLIV